MRAILTYHSLDGSGSPISVPPAVFSEHMSWLMSNGVRILSLDELVSLSTDAHGSADAVAITFDDGFTSCSHAVGWLAERGVPATVFVVTAHVGADNTWEGRTERGIPTLPLMGWAELERLVGLGVTIGAHTRTHRRLTDLASAAIEDEMEQCVEDLRARLGVGAAHLAYPYGAVDDRVAALASARFTSALTTRFGPLSPADVPPRLPRLDMYYFRRPGAIGSWGTREFHRRLGWVRLRRRMREVVT